MSCGDKRTVEPIKPPAERLTCAVEPPPPEASTDKAVAEFIVALVEAGRDCRSQLAYVRDYFAKLP